MKRWITRREAMRATVERCRLLKRRGAPVLARDIEDALQVLDAVDAAINTGCKSEKIDNLRQILARFEELVELT